MAVVGDVLRRLVSRTLAQQFAERFDAVCQPYQYALSTRWSKALVHTLQYLTQTTPVDGVGAYDHVCESARNASGLAGHTQRLQCVALCSPVVQHAVHDRGIDGNNCPRRVTQAEGGEQGDALMPARF